jgi:hypothetical protein
MKATSTSIHRGAIVMTDKLRELIQVHEGQEVLVEINKLPLKRSLAQNKYYWSVVVPTFRTLWNEVLGGITKEMAHDMLRANFLPLEIPSPKTGEVVRISKSTTELSTKEFGEYIQACRHYYLMETGEELAEPSFLK